MNTLILIGVSLCVGQAVQVDQPHAECGLVKRGPLLRHDFVLRNPGAVPLAIGPIRPSCGCLQPQLSAATIPPGGRVTLTVTINTLTQPAGQNTWRVTVGPNDRELSVSAHLIREVDLTPAALVLAGQASAELTLTDSRPRSLTFTDLRCTLPNVQVTAVPGTTRIAVRVVGPVPAGRHEGFVCLTSSDPDYPLFQVPLTVIGASALRTVPERGVLRQVGQSLLVQVRGPETEPVVVERVEAIAPLETKWAAGPGTFATVRIKWATPAPTGQAEVRVWVVGQATPLIVPLSWLGP
jgi:hypothetical protein